MDLVAHFQSVIAAEDRETFFARAMACPALLWEAAAGPLRAWIETQPASGRSTLLAYLDMLQKLGAELAANLGQWPPGMGPIEKLAAASAADEIPLAQAIALAREAAPCLSPPYVRILADTLRVQAVNGDWPGAIPAFQLLLAATDALGPEAAATEMRSTAALDWIETVAAACHAVPDGRLFSDAVRRGAALAAEGKHAGLAMHRLGVLHLDPYMSGRSPQTYASAIAAWRQRFVDTYGSMVAADPTTAVPDPVEAFSTAISWFRKALDHRQGEARGRTLKAMAEALFWREIAGGPADHEAVRAAAEEALTLLPAAKNATHVQALRGLLAYIEQDNENAVKEDTRASGDDRLSGDLLWLDPADVAQRYGKSGARERYLMQAGTLLHEDPHTAIALILRLWPSLEGAEAEDARRSAVQILSNALARAADASQVIKEAGSDPARLRPALAAAVRQGDWTAGRQAAALAGIAAALTNHNREPEGLELIAQALEITQTAHPGIVPLLRVLQADLVLGEGVNAYNAERWDDAIQVYLAAVGRYDAVGMPESALNALLRAEDVTFAGPDRPLEILTIGLSQHAGALAARGAPRVMDRVQTIWNRILARLGSQSPANPVHMWLALQGAKGASFAAMLGHDRYDWRQDAEATALLARIAALKKRSEDATKPEDPLGDSLLLVAHAGTDAEGSEAEYNPRETLERRFDALLAHRQTGGEVHTSTYLLGDELEEATGQRSVLMSIHLGRTEQGKLAVTTLLQGGEELAAAQGHTTDLPSGLVQMQGKRHIVEMSFFGPVVAALRDHMLEDPWPDTVGPEAAAGLAQDHKTLLSGVAKGLARMRAAGRDHLCIHPHGPYHFHPLHLIGPEGHPLADDWIVTTLPHPAVLRSPETSGMPDRGVPVAALGLDFAGGQLHGLRPLPGAAEEARGVAAILGGSCYVNEEATRARFFEAIQGARRVHVSTHGEHDVSAPAFQRLYLHPDAASDGVVYAYEITGLDLRGLDLVTLSACETALGRSDIADNLRGLPAALFVAGVATIVSTLWPVADAPARLFFETFYQGISKQQGKLDAFRMAQLVVRKAHPEWRDWGAFHYAGRW